MPTTKNHFGDLIAGNLLYRWLWLVGLSVLFAACASLPDSKRRQSEDGVVAEVQTAPVLGAGTRLNKASSDQVIHAVAGTQSVQQVAQLDRLVTAVREQTQSPFMLGNKVAVLVDGPETFMHLRRSIASAVSSVHVETYIFSDDELGKRFAQLLMDKARAGVEVRVIFDAFGSVNSSAQLFDDMRNAGVQVLAFHPLTPLATLPRRYNNRDHRKLLIVDGRLAFTGGLNISGTYSSGSAVRPGPERGVSEGWRDTHAQIEGPAVRLFQSIFFETWVGLGGQVAADNGKYFPTLPEVGMDIVSAVASAGMRQRDESIYSSYLAAVQNAAQRIWITQAYFSPPPELRDALIAAAQRGVDVRILVPGFTDSSPVFYAARAGYAPLLVGGVRLFEVTDALLHAKTAVIDQRLSVIGSANLDYRSFLHNNEVTAIIISQVLGQRMEQLFATDISRAKEIELAAWRQRSAGEKLKETLSRLFNYWL